MAVAPLEIAAPPPEPRMLLRGSWYAQRKDMLPALRDFEVEVGAGRCPAP